MYFTDDPVKDFERWDAEQQKALDRLPKCADCGEPIQSEYYFEFDCCFYCEDCLGDYHRKSTEDFVE